MKTSDTDIWRVLMLCGFLTLLIIGLFFGLTLAEAEREGDRQAATRAQVDTFYELMVGDSASILTGVQDLNKALKGLCQEIARTKGVHPDYCKDG